MKKQHFYNTRIQWTGNTGEGTKTYNTYDKAYVITAENKPPILGSSDPSFRGDSSKYNPEELLVASLSACHMLWYLHLCAVNNIEVLSYQDHAEGIMTEEESGGGKFKEVVLRPIIKISNSQRIDRAYALHQEAHKLCFIANSVNFEVRCEADLSA